MKGTETSLIYQTEESGDADWITSLRAAQAGDARAFDVIVRRFQNSVVAYAYTVLRDFPLSHDVAQETFLQAWRDLPTLAELPAFPAWLRRITFKYCDRARRRRSVATIGDRGVMELFGFAADPVVNDPARLLLKREETRDRNRRIWDALATLTPGERVVVTLFYFGERDQNESALFLGVTPQTVRKRLERARNRMKGYLETMLETELIHRVPSRNDRFAEVARLLRQITDHLEKDARVVAAYLAHFGISEGFGAEDDAYSSLNIHVVVRDENLDGFAATRRAYVSALGEPLLFVEAPQNAPAKGGYYLMAVYEGEAGPYETDWYWHGAKEATIPADTRILFDRVGLPRQAAPTAWGRTDNIPPALQALRDAQTGDEKRAEELRNTLSLFWAMWLISAKYIAREPNQEQVPFLPMLRSLLHTAQSDTGTMARDKDAVEPARPRASDKLGRLRALGAEAQELMTKAAALGAIIVPHVPVRAYRFADLIEAQLKSEAPSPANHGTIAVS